MQEHEQQRTQHKVMAVECGRNFSRRRLCGLLDKISNDILTNNEGRDNRTRRAPFINNLITNN